MLFILLTHKREHTQILVFNCVCLDHVKPKFITGFWNVQHHMIVNINMGIAFSLGRLFSGWKFLLAVYNKTILVTEEVSLD